MISNVNNNQPSFQGMYVLKGKAKTVRIAKEMIIDRCGGCFQIGRENMAKILGKEVQKPYVGFNDIETLNLVPIYSDSQSLVHQLVATNEHVPNVVNWYKTMLSGEKDPLVKKIEQVKVFKTPNGTIVEGDIGGIIKGLQAKMKMVSEKIAPYQEAERAAQNGNMDKMSDFLIDAMQQVKQRLQEVRDLATVPYSEPKVLKAKEVIDAIKNGRFDFITGEIK